MQLTPWITDLQNYPYEQAMTTFAAAVGCGILIGIERERHNTANDRPAFAGFRTYVLVTLMGAMTFLFGMAVGIAGFLFVSGIALISQLKNTPSDPGITSEVALTISFLIGAMCVWQPAIATSSSVIVTGFLLSKNSLNNFASRWLTSAEVRDGTILLALALIALPLMPNHPYWGTVLNPYVILRLLVLILGIQALAHLAKRLLSLRQATLLSGLASGFVSSTATIASLGLSVRTKQASEKVGAAGALMSCVATLLQLAVIALGVGLAWLKVLALPIMVGSLIGAVWAWWLIKSDKNFATTTEADTIKTVSEQDNRMFSLKEAALVAVALTLIQVLIYGLGQWIGDKGVMAGTLLASLFELHAAMAAVFLQGDPVLSLSNTLFISLLLGMAVHTISKSVNAVLTGGWGYARYLIPALWVQMFGFSGGVLVLMFWGGV